MNNAMMTQLIMFAGIIAVMYFMMIKPQKQAAQKKQAMMDGLKKGDYVITIGGLHGIIDEVDRANQIVVLDCEGIYLTFELAALASVKEPIKPQDSMVAGPASVSQE
ncbi:preprotein translocase subunit YajC [Vaginisenegalia massiliensis]|uniref:preprotein translocase subunit YajC n=1 Tax=Vaginisenegalia massiliensis TaxID=2058294 RepID=UPI001F1554D7|nr:preprotein translocase subunit YajC [Vaginisenegalia massiliensis]